MKGSGASFVQCKGQWHPAQHGDHYHVVLCTIVHCIFLSQQSGTVLGSGASLNEVDEDDSPPPAILVYLVDPFNVGEDHPDMHRLVTLGLLRCYEHMLDGLPESMKNNVYLQVGVQFLLTL